MNIKMYFGSYNVFMCMNLLAFVTCQSTETTMPDHTTIGKEDILTVILRDSTCTTENSLSSRLDQLAAKIQRLSHRNNDSSLSHFMDSIINTTSHILGKWDDNFREMYNNATLNKGINNCYRDNIIGLSIQVAEVRGNVSSHYKEQLEIKERLNDVIDKINRISNKTIIKESDKKDASFSSHYNTYSESLIQKKTIPHRITKEKELYCQCNESNRTITEIIRFGEAVLEFLKNITLKQVMPDEEIHRHMRELSDLRLNVSNTVNRLESHLEQRSESLRAGRNVTHTKVSVSSDIISSKCYNTVTHTHTYAQTHKYINI